MFAATTNPAGTVGGVTATGTSATGRTMMFTVAVRDGKIALRADNGLWVSRYNHGDYQTIEACKSEIDQYCLFAVELQGNVIALLADNGRYVGRASVGFERMQADSTALDRKCLLSVNA